MLILLVKKDSATRSALTFLLESELEAEVREASSVQEGLYLLLDDSLKFDILVCEDEFENQKLFKYLMNGDMQIRCFILKGSKKSSIVGFPDLIVASVNPVNPAAEIKAALANNLKNFKIETLAGEDVNFCRIRAQKLLQYVPLACDTFVRLSASKYVRIFKQGDDFSIAEINEFLVRKKIVFLYLLKSDALAFANKLKQELEKDLHSATFSAEDATLSAIAAQEAALELGSRIGFTPEVQALAKQGMLITLRTVTAGKPQLLKIFKKIISNKDNYAGAHAILTAQISCSLASGLEWVSDTTFQKLTFASFFHDMALLDKNLDQVRNLQELEKRKSEFTEEQYKNFINHPILAAEQIRSFSEVPPDVDTIIIQHHERPDGSGFPRKITANNIAPLAAVFIIAHDIVDYLFDHGTENVEDFFSDYRTRNSIGQFKKILDQIDLGKVGLPEAPKIFDATTLFKPKT